jgi:DNA polymerase III epsilon subunit-like protein
MGAAEVTIDHVDREPLIYKGAPCFDYMVDIETTGTSPEHAAILQIAGVRFNRHTKEIDTASFFDRCLTIPPNRFWSESTREWWMGKPDVIRPILARAEPAKMVLQAFQDWVLDGPSIEPKAFWGKPITFDYMFLSSYFRQFEIENPFHYRECMDLNSYIAGRGHNDRRKFWKGIEPVGSAHNALHDCLYQIRAVFNA